MSYYLIDGESLEFKEGLEKAGTLPFVFDSGTYIQDGWNDPRVSEPGIHAIRGNANGGPEAESYIDEYFICFTIALSGITGMTRARIAFGIRGQTTNRLFLQWGDGSSWSSWIS